MNKIGCFGWLAILFVIGSYAKNTAAEIRSVLAAEAAAKEKAK